MPVCQARSLKHIRAARTQLLVCLSSLVILSACRDAPPSLVPVFSARPSQTATYVSTASPSPRTSPTPRPSATATLPATVAPVATETPRVTLVATPTPTASATATPTRSPCPTSSPPSVTQQLTLFTPDGLALAAILYLPEGDGPFPGVVLAHMGGSSQKSWDALPETLRQTGYAVLTFDFRGHGESNGNPDPPKAALDLTTALLHMRSLPQVGNGQIGLVGASMGGMASVIVGAANPDVRTVVGISTSPGAAGQNPNAVIGQLSPRSFLAIGCKQDPLTRPERVTQLFDAAGEPKQIILLDCSAHANDILDTETGPQLSRQLLQWLDSHLLNSGP